MPSVGAEPNKSGRAKAEPVEQGIGLYEIRQKIYPRAVSGWFATWRWVFVWLTQLVFYVTPWINLNGRQAVLFDLEARRFYLGSLILTPQDFIYLAVLLVISAFALFLFTTVGGRLWCGYACPQTVYTEIFLWIERKVEGDRGKRLKLDRQPKTARWLRLKSTKHAIWIAVALFTGYTFVGYFTPIRELVGQVMRLDLGPWQWFWILFYAFATYGNAGFMREQVCKYMCPYARFQSAMFDDDTLIITYDQQRGDPRGTRSRKADKGALGLGDCIDCGLCVEVCPTGIDIRDGLQYECIGCAACIDACDKVMGKMNYSPGLIRYDTGRNMKLAGTGQAVAQFNIWRLFRPRVLVYSAILGAICLALVFSMWSNVPFKVDVLRDRHVLSRITSSGQVENGFRLVLINNAEDSQRFEVQVRGIDGIEIVANKPFLVKGASNRVVPIRVRAEPGAGVPGSNKISFTINTQNNPAITVSESAAFFIGK